MLYSGASPAAMSASRSVPSETKPSIQATKASTTAALFCESRTFFNCQRFRSLRVQAKSEIESLWKLARQAVENPPNRFGFNLT